MTFPAPFAEYTGEVRPEWIDSNDHMNLAYYTVMFDFATDALYAACGMGPGYRDATGCGTFAAETHNTYVQELRLGERVLVKTLVLAADAKRLHLAHEMFRLTDGARAATQELLYLHVDLTCRRVAPWPEPVRICLEAALAAHAALPKPGWVGRRIGDPPLSGR